LLLFGAATFTQKDFYSKRHCEKHVCFLCKLFISSNFKAFLKLFWSVLATPIYVLIICLLISHTWSLLIHYFCKKSWYNAGLNIATIWCCDMLLKFFEVFWSVLAIPNICFNHLLTIFTLVHCSFTIFCKKVDKRQD